MDKYVIKPLDYRWAALPALAFVIASLLLVGLANNQVDVTAAGAARETSEAAARLHVLGTMLLFVVVAAGTVLKVTYDVVTTFVGEIKRRLVILGLLGIAFSAMMIGITFTETWPDLTELLGSPLLAVEARTGVVPQDGLWTADMLNWLALIYSVFVALASIALVVAMVSCLAALDPAENPKPDEETKNWVQQSERLQNYIYLATAVLVVGIFALRAWASYPTIVLEGDAFAKPLAGYKQVFDAYLMFQGIQYSLILAAIAIPVAWRLSYEADQIAERKVAEMAKKTGAASQFLNMLTQATKKEQKLAITPWDAFKLIIALLAPLIAGTLTGLTGALG